MLAVLRAVGAVVVVNSRGRLVVVVETLGKVRRTRQRRSKRNADIVYCQRQIEETRRLLNHMMRDYDARRDLRD